MIRLILIEVNIPMLKKKKKKNQVQPISPLINLFGYRLLMKTKNWKHCSKIIFKCVNSVVEPIFNEKIVKKKRFVGLVNSAWDPLETPQLHRNMLEKKKKNADADVGSAKCTSQTHTKQT